VARPPMAARAPAWVSMTGIIAFPLVSGKGTGVCADCPGVDTLGSWCRWGRMAAVRGMGGGWEARRLTLCRISTTSRRYRMGGRARGTRGHITTRPHMAQACRNGPGRVPAGRWPRAWRCTGAVLSGGDGVAGTGMRRRGKGRSGPVSAPTSGAAGPGALAALLVPLPRFIRRILSLPQVSPSVP
jgi:hypothetical protein